MNKFIGKRFGCKKILREVGKPDEHGNKTYEYKCIECGRVGYCSSSSLYMYPKNCKHCVAGAKIKHPEITGALLKDRLYKLWIAMRGACNNKNSSRYVNFGGRGFKVCKEWDSFTTFKKDVIDAGYTDEDINKMTLIPSDMTNKIISKYNFIFLPVNTTVLIWKNFDRTNPNKSIKIYKDVFSLAQKHNMNIKTVLDRLRRGWELSDAVRTPPRARRDNFDLIDEDIKKLKSVLTRDEQIVYLYKKDYGVTNISRYFNLSRERVYQILRVEILNEQNN